MLSKKKSHFQQSKIFQIFLFSIISIFLSNYANAARSIFSGVPVTNLSGGTQQFFLEIPPGNHGKLEITIIGANGGDTSALTGDPDLYVSHYSRLKTAPSGNAAWPSLSNSQYRSRRSVNNVERVTISPVLSSQTTSTAYLHWYLITIEAFTPYTGATLTATLTAKSSNFSLTIRKIGTGPGGDVYSTPAGIDCGPSCTATFPANSVLNIAAIPKPGSKFNGLTGAGCGGNTGRITLNRNLTCTVSFAPTVCTNFDFASITGSVSGTWRSGTANWEGSADLPPKCTADAMNMVMTVRAQYERFIYPRGEKIPVGIRVRELGPRSVSIMQNYQTVFTRGSDRLERPLYEYDIRTGLRQETQSGETICFAKITASATKGSLTANRIKIIPTRSRSRC